MNTSPSVGKEPTEENLTTLLSSVSSQPCPPSSGDSLNTPAVTSRLESSEPPQKEAKISSSCISKTSSTSSVGGDVIDAGATADDAGRLTAGASSDGQFSSSIADSVGIQRSTALDNQIVTAPSSTAATTATTNVVVTATVTALSSHPNPPPSGTTTTTKALTTRRECFSPAGSLPPPRGKMVLGHPSSGFNGHALLTPSRVPTGDNRGPLRSPSPVLLRGASSGVTAEHYTGGRSVGPIAASVPPPPLRAFDALRERGRLSSVSHRLMSKPVKRKLWEVDQEKLSHEIEKEYRESIKEEEERFKERWEELGPEETDDAPAFYFSEVITKGKKDVLTSSSNSSSSSDSSPVHPRNVPSSSSAATASPGSTAAKGEAEKPLSDEVGSENSSSKAGEPSSDPSETPKTSEDLPKVDEESPNGEQSEGSLLSESQMNKTGILTRRRALEASSSPTLSASPSPSLSSSFFYSSSSSSSSSSNTSASSLNQSTSSSRSSSGVSSMESTPVRASATPSTMNPPSGAGRTGPTQGLPARPPKPSTRSCPQRRVPLRNRSRSPPRKHLRM